MGNIEIYRNNVCYLLQAPGLLLGWACPSSRPFPTAPSSWGPSSRQSRRSGGRTCGILPLQGQRLLRKAVTVDNRKIQAVFEVDQCQRSICCEADYSAEHRVIDGSTLSIPWYWETIASMILRNVVVALQMFRAYWRQKAVGTRAHTNVPSTTY